MRGSRGTVGIWRLVDAAAQYLRVFRLADDDLCVRHLLGKHSRYTLERSAGAVSSYPIVKFLVPEILDDLSRCGPRMHVGIGLVLELTGQEPTVGAGKLDRLGHHRHAAPCLRWQHDPGAQQ